jgi:hypothetical protein
MIIKTFHKPFAVAFLLLSTTLVHPKVFGKNTYTKDFQTALDEDVRTKYESLGIQGLDYFVFLKAYNGYKSLSENGKIKNKVLSIVDFSKSSNTERLYVIDMEQNKLVLKSLVAHGKKSGDEFAHSFANILNSGKSSLGFYLTGETYIGKHGYSLRLDGLEDCNNEARSRAIVIHSADYVSQDFISKYGRLGRSQGCPALPKNLSNEIIDIIKEESCLFIFHPTPEYLNNSFLIKK